MQNAILIALINATCSFPIFTEERTHLEMSPLPFFEKYVLIKATCFSTIPPVTMCFLWDNKNHVIKTDGTRDCIFDNLPKLGLVLNDSTLVPYVRFVLDCVQTENGSLRLVETFDEIEFSDRPTEDETAFLKKIVRPAVCKKNDDHYLLTAIVIYGETVFEAEIKVEKNGKFDFTNEKSLGENMRCLRQIFLE